MQFSRIYLLQIFWKISHNNYFSKIHSKPLVDYLLIFENLLTIHIKVTLKRKLSKFSENFHKTFKVIVLIIPQFHFKVRIQFIRFYQLPKIFVELFLSFPKIFQFNHIFFKLSLKVSKNLYEIFWNYIWDTSKLLRFTNCTKHSIQFFHKTSTYSQSAKFHYNFLNRSLKFLGTTLPKFLETPLNFTLLGTDSAIMSTPTWTIKESWKTLLLLLYSLITAPI